MSTRPRIRTLKPDMWQDERVGQLTRDQRLLFVALITLADDFGRFRALPAAIIGHAYPYDDDAARKLPGWLRALAASGLIVLYEHDGIPYGWLPKWDSHQRINRRAEHSSLPEPSVNGKAAKP